MRECFEWLVKHERLVVAFNFILVIAFVVQIKYCNQTVETDADLSQSQPPVNQIIQSSASSNNIAGKWEMSVPNRKGEAQIWTLTLEQKDEMLKGVINSEGGDLPLTGTIKGQSIILTATRFGVTVEFSATLDKDIMKGTMRALMVKRQWTAKRCLR